MIKLKLVLSLCIIFVLIACSEDVESSSSFGYKKEAISNTYTESDTNISYNTFVIERKIIKEGWITYEVDSLIESKNRLLEVTKKFNAYISSDREYKTSSRITSRIIVKVPSKNFDDLILSLSQEAKYIDNKEISYRDVTEEYIDVESRLHNKKALEKRYLEILDDAQTVTDILEVEKEIGQIREDIESTEGRLNYLKHSISFSTLDITMYETIALKDGSNNRLVQGIVNGWNHLITFFLLLVNIWPFIIILAALLLVIRIFKKRKK